MLPGLMCSGEFGVLLLLVLLCCVCGSTTGLLRVVCLVLVLCFRSDVRVARVGVLGEVWRPCVF